MEFNYETETVRNVTSSELLLWLSDTFAELETNKELSTETEQQLDILLKLADDIRK